MLSPYAKGVDAYNNGDGIDDNPYDYNEQPDDWQSWRDGWGDAFNNNGNV